MPITRKDVDRACSGTAWDLGNSILYDLCKKYPEHKSDDVILAKILIIGRVYAAAIERRKAITERGDDFYLGNVLPKIKASNIDDWIRGLGKSVDDNEESILCVHSCVTRLFNSISGQDKRSLASKYLHFHRPDLFFIYDERALAGVRILTPRMRADLSQYDQVKIDKDYASFFVRCLMVRKRIQKSFQRMVTPRELDNVLIMFSDRNLAP